jgi:hypothetical protein
MHFIRPIIPFGRFSNRAWSNKMSTLRSHSIQSACRAAYLRPSSETVKLLGFFFRRRYTAKKLRKPEWESAL